jgi:hypothetical protein
MLSVHAMDDRLNRSKSNKRGRRRRSRSGWEWRPGTSSPASSSSAQKGGTTSLYQYLGAHPDVGTAFNSDRSEAE